jgi:hypothetical protein
MELLLGHPPVDPNLVELVIGRLRIEKCRGHGHYVLPPLLPESIVGEVDDQRSEVLGMGD